ncbi:hypothetical protein [Alteromonas profundi]|uniref:hypothetical protein n=1 Tax=Alteromonas profundi TaxID=2696062 RepID=UPI0013D77FBB|nr:hypothetical protein [Alteromonas profundi]
MSLPIFTFFRVAVFSGVLLFSSHAFSNLLIHPTRVNLTPDLRTFVITVGNTANVTATYELSWAEKRALPQGGYESLDGKENEAVNSVSEMVRFSPRRVTLKPGERQSIKLLLRRARGLSDGEFRSHLRFKAVPNNSEAFNGVSQSTSMKVNVVLNFAIPVALQVGDYDAAIAIDSASIAINKDGGAGVVTTRFAREGLHSTWGDIEAYWKPNGGKEVLLAKSGGVNVWAELDTLTQDLTMVNGNFTPNDGELRVVYKGIGAYSDIVYDEKTFTISKQDIQVR